MMSDILLETDRLYIRPLQREDLPALQKIKEAIWPELQKWMRWASDDQKTYEALAENFDSFIQNDYKKGGLRLIAIHKETGDIVMCTGLDLTDKPSIFSTGYWGNVKYLGQGYATESTRALIEYAFNKHNAEKILINYYEGNNASKRVIEKCGFKFVKTKAKAHQSFATGEWLDIHCYELSNS